MSKNQGDIFAEMKKISPQELLSAGVIKSARGKSMVNGSPTFICPLCDNGTGDSGDGLTVKHYDWGYNYHCFKCGEDFTAVDLIGAMLGLKAHSQHNENLSRIAQKAQELFSWLATDKTISSFNENKKLMGDVGSNPKNNFSKQYEEWRGNLEDFIKSQGGSYRGLPLEIFKKHGCGFDKRNGGWLIIPYDSSHYFRRAISADEMNPKKHIGGKGIYNFDCITSEIPTLLLEGEIDCLSIEYAADYPCVALGGAAEWGNFIRKLNETFQTVEKKPRFLIMFDNNDKGAGQDNAKKFISELNRAGYPAVNIILSPSEGYDANDFLQKYGGEGLLRRITDILSAVDEKLNQNAELLKEMTQIQNPKITTRRNYFLNRFDDDSSVIRKFSGRSTGFANIDNQMVFAAGLYVIGGLASLGKTTFCWQLADFLASVGEKVIFVSLEMAAAELYPKSVAREIFLHDENTKLTALDIRRGGFSQTADEIIDGYKNRTGGVMVYEAEQENIDEIIRELEKFCAVDDKPTIFIDYLQIVNHGKENEKAGLDYVVRKLKLFQRKYGLTIIVISSMNRQNYSNIISFESFSGSGGIEYGCDVLWGLQLACVNDFGVGKSENEKRQAYQQAKKMPVRDIELVCLKNRFGNVFNCRFAYYAAHDYFHVVGTASTSRKVY